MTLIENIKSVLGSSTSESLWENALLLGDLLNKDSEKREVCRDLIAQIREHQGQIACESTESTLVVMGTSGWRDRIGDGFTLCNVRRVINGIIEMMKSKPFLSQSQLQTFDDVKDKGVIIFRDNRYLGKEFCQVAMEELTAQGIRVYDAGECPTGVGSALLTSLNAAGSINFTPSHNPMDYQGLKFNPADGGPAPKEITDLIEKFSNGLMDKIPNHQQQYNSTLVKRLDAKKIYIEYLLEKSLFDLNKIRGWLSENREDLLLVVDYMHGSARGFVEELFGESLIKELMSSSALRFINTNDDFSFHGLKPEPSAKNQAPLIKMLKDSKRKLTLAVAMDPDADRIRFSDADMDLDMNRFSAIAYSIELQTRKNTGIVSTAPSSDFALEMAKQNNCPFYETAVGFKYFRPYLSENKVCMAFEESDGISFGGHTLEKDALIGFISAINSMMVTGHNLSFQYEQLQQKYGYFYPEKVGVEVKGISVEKWQEYKSQVVDVLKHKLFKVGDTLAIGSDQQEIINIQTVDGLKLNFSDRSWILLRPSGTEPKFRIYFEVASDDKIGQIENRLNDYHQCGIKILESARASL